MAQAPADPARTEAFVHKVLGDASGAFTTTLAVLGDRLGLFKELAARGPATSEELAERSRVNERYAREWLGGMAAAGYLEYDPKSRRFALPPEHVPALAEEKGPFFFGGVYQMFPAMVGVLEQLTVAFREGGGVAQSAYHPSLWDGLERFTAGWFENLLVQQWIPAMPDVKAKLEAGAAVADVGAGRGQALLKLARQFPRSRYVGYDVFPPAVEEASAKALAEGLAERVRFEQCDAAQGLPESYDVITTFDVVHDAARPRDLLRAIRQALRPGGLYVCLDVNASHRLEENLGPLGAFFHGASVFYCMTTSLASGGEGLGTLGFNEAAVRELCREAGFGAVRRVPLENPFNILYEIRP